MSGRLSAKERADRMLSPASSRRASSHLSDASDGSLSDIRDLKERLAQRNQGGRPSESVIYGLGPRSSPKRPPAAEPPEADSELFELDEFADHDQPWEEEEEHTGPDRSVSPSLVGSDAPSHASTAPLVSALVSALGPLQEDQLKMQAQLDMLQLAVEDRIAPLEGRALTLESLRIRVESLEAATKSDSDHLAEQIALHAADSRAAIMVENLGATLRSFYATQEAATAQNSSEISLINSALAAIDERLHADESIRKEELTLATAAIQSELAAERQSAQQRQLEGSERKAGHVVDRLVVRKSFHPWLSAARQLQQQRGAEQLTSLQAQEAAAQSLIRELEGQVGALATEQSQNATEQQKALELRIAELSAQQQQALEEQQRVQAKANSTAANSDEHAVAVAAAAMAAASEDALRAVAMDVQTVREDCADIERRLSEEFVSVQVTCDRLSRHVSANIDDLNGEALRKDLEEQRTAVDMCNEAILALAEQMDAAVTAIANGSGSGSGHALEGSAIYPQQPQPQQQQPQQLPQQQNEMPYWASPDWPTPQAQDLRAAAAPPSATAATVPYWVSPDWPPPQGRDARRAAAAPPTSPAITTPRSPPAAAVRTAAVVTTGTPTTPLPGRKHQSKGKAAGNALKPMPALPGGGADKKKPMAALPGAKPNMPPQRQQQQGSEQERQESEQAVLAVDDDDEVMGFLLHSEPGTAAAWGAATPPEQPTTAAAASSGGSKPMPALPLPGGSGSAAKKGTQQSTTKALPPLPKGSAKKRSQPPLPGQGGAKARAAAVGDGQRQ
jgi:hypothetical protein